MDTGRRGTKMNAAQPHALEADCRLAQAARLLALAAVLALGLWVRLPDPLPDGLLDEGRTTSELSSSIAMAKRCSAVGDGTRSRLQPDLDSPLSRTRPSPPRITGSGRIRASIRSASSAPSGATRSSARVVEGLDDPASRSPSSCSPGRIRSGREVSAKRRGRPSWRCGSSTGSTSAKSWRC